jgi:2-polyprenyl-6-methoxyphenol hydroxylase-like FAD-dependent oxidoreductase
VSVSSALVIGGGITGSVLSLALAQRGVRVDLAEITRDWHGVGHGITLQGNALAALQRVGVLPEVLRRGVPFDTLRMRQADGTLIAELPTPRTGGADLPATLGALRSDLQAVLRDRVYAAGVNVRLGLTVRAVTSDAAHAHAEFTDGTAGDYDLIAGADGIRSAVRGLLGITTSPQPTGMSIWRVVAGRPAELDCSELYYYGPRYKAGYSPISAG